jgi:hypothetical protein
MSSQKSLEIAAGDGPNQVWLDKALSQQGEFFSRCRDVLTGEVGTVFVRPTYTEPGPEDWLVTHGYARFEGPTTVCEGPISLAGYTKEQSGVVVISPLRPNIKTDAYQA